MGIAVQFLQIQMGKNALYASGAYIMTQKKMHIKQRFNVIQDSTKQKKVNCMDQLKLKYYIEV